jgi:hypothetical protein
MHEGGWIEDITSKQNLGSFMTMTDSEVRLRHASTRNEVYDRDACLLLERRFFATGKGVALNPAMLAVLREAEFLRVGDTRDEYAVFGHRSDGTADGKTGRWRSLEGTTADAFMRLVTSAVDDTWATAMEDMAQRRPIAENRTVCNRACD